MRRRSWLVACATTCAVAACGDGASARPDFAVVGAVAADSDVGATVTPASVGVGAGDCAAGFVYDGNAGCTPILPAERCPDGLVAFLGDTACHDLAPCGAAPWGDGPWDDATVYVDGSADDAFADGTRVHPWATIARAADHAIDGATIALAAGRYAESFAPHRAVRLLGRCPSLVSVLLGSPIDAPLDVDAVRIEELNIATSSPEIDTLELHATTHLSRTLLPDGYLLKAMDGATVTVTRSLAPDTLSLGGVWATDLVARSAEAGAIVTLGSVVLERVVVDAAVGAGVIATPTESTGNEGLTIDASVIRGVRKETFGSAIDVPAAIESAAGSVVITRSVIADCDGIGVHVIGGDVTMARTLVARMTPAAAKNGAGGLVLDVEPAGDGTYFRRSTARVVDSTFDAIAVVAIAVNGSTADLDGVLVRNTAVDPSGAFGRGLDAQVEQDSGFAPRVTVRRSVFERNHEGAIVAGAGAVLVGDDVLVVDTGRNGAGAFGDGVDVERATARISHFSAVRNARAGVASFGGQVTLDSVLFADDGIDLDGECEGTSAPSFTAAAGAALCRTAGVDHACQAASTGLAPPSGDDAHACAP